MRKIKVVIEARGFVMVPDIWTDEEIETDTDHFDEVVIESMLESIDTNNIYFEVKEAESTD